jgi:hypothetical protein
MNLNPAVEIIRASQALDLASEIAVFINCGAVGRSSFASRAYASTAGFRMKRFADSIAREKGVRPPPGYATSGLICRAFLNQHAPKKADTEIPGASGSKPASPAQILFAEKLAQEKGIVIPDEAKASSAAMSTWIDSNQVKKTQEPSQACQHGDEFNRSQIRTSKCVPDRASGDLERARDREGQGPTCRSTDRTAVRDSTADTG